MDAVRAWMTRDPPPNDLLLQVVEFGTELERNPERGAVQEHATLYTRELPGTEHGGRIVSITFELTSLDEVRCKDIVCIPYPEGEQPPDWPPAKHH